MPTFICALLVWLAILLTAFPELALWLWRWLDPPAAALLEPAPVRLELAWRWPAAPPVAARLELEVRR